MECRPDQANHRANVNSKPRLKPWSPVRTARRVKLIVRPLCPNAIPISAVGNVLTAHPLTFCHALPNATLARTMQPPPPGTRANAIDRCLVLYTYAKVHVNARRTAAPRRRHHDGHHLRQAHLADCAVAKIYVAYISARLSVGTQAPTGTP